MSGTPEVTTWAALGLDDFIVDANGAAWQIGARRDGDFPMIQLWLKPAVNDGRRAVVLRKRHDHQVVAVDVSPEEAARRGALQLLQHYLGGVVETPEVSAVDEPLPRAMLHAHLQCYHGLATAGMTMAQLVSTHTIDHAAPSSPTFLPHIHV